MERRRLLPDFAPGRAAEAGGGAFQAHDATGLPTRLVVHSQFFNYCEK
jgi:hypothetical protein